MCEHLPSHVAPMALLLFFYPWRVGMTGRIPHDLRRSGVKHYIDAGVDPYTVMRWSGHRTE
jgi:integrase